jgi:circadian clock protein KaiB
LTAHQLLLPQSFKGIALFTPGGDLIYGIDPNKQAHWHIHLCAGLQEILGLSEPPHFLVPGYTATVDRWLEPCNQQLITLGEVYPAIQRYIPLLAVMFETEEKVWQIAPWQEECCDPMIIETYRDRFPQLWEDHDLLVRFDPNNTYLDLKEVNAESTVFPTTPIKDNYILRLFVAGNNKATEKTLASIHTLLEEGLAHPYTLKVIDIAQHPEQAEIHQVSATPTLVRVWPEPIRRIIGELNDLQRVLRIISTF